MTTEPMEAPFTVGVWSRRAAARIARWWTSGPTRLRQRRHLLTYSIPVILALLWCSGRIITITVAGNDTVDAFTRHDIGQLQASIDTIDTWNLVQPNKLPFAQGALAVLQNRLDDAEQRYQQALTDAGGDQICPTRINLELVQETRGDLAARQGDKPGAEQHYKTALQTVSGAPGRCFAGNTDPNPDRQHIRQDAEPRLKAKIASLHQPPPAPPPAPAPPAPAPASPAPATPTPAPTTAAAPPTTAPIATTAPTPPPTTTPPGGPDNATVFGPTTRDHLRNRRPDTQRPRCRPHPHHRRPTHTRTPARHHQRKPARPAPTSAAKRQQHRQQPRIALGGTTTAELGRQPPAGAPST